MAHDLEGLSVSGEIDASFEGGYLLSVRVADTTVLLRGVVFAAEEIPTNLRRNLRPPLNTYSRRFRRFRHQDVERPREPQEQAPNPQPAIPETLENHSPTVIPKNDASSSSEKPMSPEIKEPRLDSESTAIVAQFESAKVVGEGQVSE